MGIEIIPCDQDHDAYRWIVLVTEIHPRFRVVRPVAANHLDVRSQLGLFEVHLVTHSTSLVQSQGTSGVLVRRRDI